MNTEFTGYEGLLSITTVFVLEVNASYHGQKLSGEHH